MWLFVFFDLPTHTKTERKEYTKIRKELLKNGYTMLQYSVYIRHCSSQENAAMHKTRVQRALPDKGHVSILQVTDKQYEKILNFWGVHLKKPDQGSINQLELF